MVIFLIPVAVVGYNMWERHKQEEQKKREMETEHITNPLVILENTTNEGSPPLRPNTSNSFDSDLSMFTNNSEHSSSTEIDACQPLCPADERTTTSQVSPTCTEEGRWAGFKRFCADHQQKLQSHLESKNTIKKPEMFAKRDSASIPMPRISYR